MAISAPAYLMLERETVLAMVDKGASVMDVAYHFSTYPAVVERLLKQWKQKPKDYAKPATTQQRKRGGVRTGKVHAFIRAIESGEVDTMREAGMTIRDIAYRFDIGEGTVSDQLRKVTVRRKPEEVDERLVPGKKYGSLIFEKEIRGKTTMYQFRHKCGFRETFTEFQWRERTA